MALESSKKNDGITIKGGANGLLIRLHDEGDNFHYPLLLDTLAVRLEQSQKFFHHAPVSVDLGRRELSFEELERLQGLLARYEMRLERIISGSNATRSSAKQVGIEFKLPTRENTRAPIPNERDSVGMPFDNAEALFVRRTLRSGQIVRHHGDVCLLGDVNPGAEIVAGGSVIVWGILRGVVQAGEGTMVCALQLTPALLGIGQIVARAPETVARYTGPEMAIVRNGSIIIEPWAPRKG